MIQVKPMKTNSRRGPLTLQELLGWLDISQTLLGPLQGDSLPENEVNSEQSRAKNDSWVERQRLMLDPVTFRIWNSSTGIPSPPLALFIVMFPKAHLTSHSRMSGSR